MVWTPERVNEPAHGNEAWTQPSLRDIHSSGASRPVRGSGSEMAPRLGANDAREIELLSRRPTLLAVIPSRLSVPRLEDISATRPL
jgi:hypothetical protein